MALLAIVFVVLDAESVEKFRVVLSRDLRQVGVAGRVVILAIGL
jgi:hypothetical protein